jgi:hypothetical protein
MPKQAAMSHWATYLDRILSDEPDAAAKPNKPDALDSHESLLRIGHGAGLLQRDVDARPAPPMIARGQSAPTATDNFREAGDGESVSAEGCRNSALNRDRVDAGESGTVA